jgi:putative membrane protein
MYSNYWGGMHTYWWVFWVFLWIMFFSFLMPVRRRNWSAYRQSKTPLDVLQQRYAAGEISTEEYEERRDLLQRDARKP